MLVGVLLFVNNYCDLDVYGLCKLPVNGLFSDCLIVFCFVTCLVFRFLSW